MGLCIANQSDTHCYRSEIHEKSIFAKRATVGRILGKVGIYVLRIGLEVTPPVLSKQIHRNSQK